MAGPVRLGPISDGPPLRNLVYDGIRDAILEGILEPGQRLTERRVADQMQVSTTPVKEAFRRLEQEGLIVTRPRRGAVVSEAALTSIEEIVEIRAGLEGVAARFAARKATATDRDALLGQLEEMGRLTGGVPESQMELEATNAGFHDLVRRIAHNHFLESFVEALEPFDRSVRHRALAVPDEAQRGFDEHRLIAAAIIDGDEGMAEGLMAAHIRRTVRFVLERVTEDRATPRQGALGTENS